MGSTLGKVSRLRRSLKAKFWDSFKVPEIARYKRKLVVEGGSRDKNVGITYQASFGPKKATDLSEPPHDRRLRGRIRIQRKNSAKFLSLSLTSPP